LHALPGAKVLAVRQTQVSNEDTSVRTFNEVYDRAGYRVQEDEEISPVPKMERRPDGADPVGGRGESLQRIHGRDRTAQDPAADHRLDENDGDRLCSYIEFRGLKDENKVEGQLRGYECSLMCCVEADLLQEQDLDLAIGCCAGRTRTAPTSTTTRSSSDSNPPSPRHWIAKMEKRVAGDPTYQFWQHQDCGERGEPAARIHCEAGGAVSDEARASASVFAWRIRGTV